MKKQTQRPEIRSLQALMVTPSEAETAEQAYRRAYRDGWVIAIDTFYECMMERGMSREAAFAMLYDCYDGALNDWEELVRDNPHAGTAEPPPRPDVDRYKK